MCHCCHFRLHRTQDRLVCVLCNLKPAAMRGVKSHAMVLAASNADHTQVWTPPLLPSLPGPAASIQYCKALYCVLTPSLLPSLAPALPCLALPPPHSTRKLHPDMWM